MEATKKRIDALVKNGDAERAVGLYEIFFSGCYEKAEEIDDSSGNLGMFFGDRLTSVRQELLDKLGRSEDAFKSAWSEFKKYPSVYGYDELMKYIPKQDFKEWHEKALLEAKG